LRPRRVLILSGGSDDSLPWDYVAAYTEKLKSGGLDVTHHCFEIEGHFLFFHRCAEALKFMAE
jgi:predicted esterase